MSDNQMTEMDADTVYLLMKENIPISRTSRIQWLLNKLNTYISIPSGCSSEWVSTFIYTILKYISY